MRESIRNKILAMFICVTMLLACFPFSVLADGEDPTVTLTAGDTLTGFAPEDAACVSDDPSIAWVDDSGTLNALKAGTVGITVTSESDGQTEYTVNVEEYTDGSDIVGNLKLLARYNDSMQFYDGHVYLLFTSYQDGVEINVPDLYAAYTISDDYYRDIRDDIANGSNHTGTDADMYFETADEPGAMTLDRGEIVTIGMYRGFSLSVMDAALGSVKNSSGWKELTAAGKSSVIKAFFSYLETHSISAEEAIAQIKAVCDEIGMDYTKLLDGVVDGGVCFNRELYNQKLEWDQYENVTYELDITRNQLKTLTMYLGGNLNNFSILKNSCATVALRAWNAAVGMRDGEPDAYYLTTSGEGIFAYIDAPKTVRDSIVDRLPGYYLNNSDYVEEPDAGYQDETGWVYVSAPEKVAPVNFVYDDDTFVIDETMTKMSALFAAARNGEPITYPKDGADVHVSITSEKGEKYTTVSEIKFTYGENTYTVNAETELEDGIFLETRADAPAEGMYYYVLNSEGEDLSASYEDGWLNFWTAGLPVSYEVGTDVDVIYNTIDVVTVGGEDTTVEVYVKENGSNVVLETPTELDPGTVVFVKAAVSEENFEEVLNDITLNGESIFDAEHYNAEEDAYFFTMPEGYTNIAVWFENAAITFKGQTLIQAEVGETIEVADRAALSIGYYEDDFVEGGLVWIVNDDPDGVVEADGTQLRIVKEGTAVVSATAEHNPNICAVFVIEAHESFEDMAKVTFNEGAYGISVGEGEEAEFVPFSGYYVAKGSALKIVLMQEDGKAILTATNNGSRIAPDEVIIADKDADINVTFANAAIVNMPGVIYLNTEDDSYQLEAKVQYTGVWKFLPVYDESIRYTSSDSLVSVDESGLVTVNGEIPEQGKAVVVSAYAGSTNDKVCAQTKVIVGDYEGARVVGRLTIHARRIHPKEMIPHSAVTFTAYEDVDLDVSYYEYYKPTKAYNDLMVDYEDHPEKYNSDPALYSDNELGIEDRESYFEIIHNGAGSDPQTISLRPGESISVSNYPFDNSDLETVVKTLESSSLAASPQVQEFIRQIKLYLDGEDTDGEVAFDSLVATLMQMYAFVRASGVNPIDGYSEGGLVVNREIYNQFRRDDSQIPNNYYTFEITADELAMLESYISDPENNRYSIFGKNCGTAAVSAWNTALSDMPELQLKGNMTGVAIDPQSIYFELALLRSKEGLDGTGGVDFYPRTFYREDDGFKFPIDVSEDAWYANAVRYCIENGIMAGTGENRFSPDADVTRSQFVLILARIDGVDLDDEEYDGTLFDDVEEDQWYSRAVVWAAKNGYTSGVGNGAFAPDAALTREQVALFLRTYSEKNGVDVSAAAALDSYTDKDEISAWALKGVEWAVAENLISGTTETTIAPKLITSRAQIAVIATNYLENVAQ